MTPDTIETCRGGATVPVRRPAPTSPASSSASLFTGVETPRQKQERERSEMQRPRDAVPNPNERVAPYREHMGLGRTQLK
ncbi:hypothetical protein KIPB_013889 [Kipferlia bialata]|uniref:Uncharacterized protein n=1 Tax=Kipferlia bialata TaxID=797122 RepID=A0A391NSL6_9EUKA|nr:hypothetical protein KIPB_013889 [Kipferlia bialata]|eukprot:g13889.t1